MSDIIEYGVKIPLYEITNVAEFNKSFANQYNTGYGACDTWYLISPISNFIQESKTLIKCKNGEYVKKEQIVYFYNNSLHTTPSKFADEYNNDIYILGPIMLKKAFTNNEKFYNTVMNLANILLYAKIDWIALPESALESPSKFITFVEKTFIKQ